MAELDDGSPTDFGYSFGIMLRFRRSVCNNRVDAGRIALGAGRGRGLVVSIELPLAEEGGR